MPTTKPVHEIDESGNDIHVDVDPYIPTGLCAICTWEPPYEPEIELPYEPEPEPEPWVDPEAPVEEELPPAPEPVEEPEETPAPETTEP